MSPSAANLDIPIQIVESEHVVTDRLRKNRRDAQARPYARDHPRPGQAWGRVRPSRSNASPLASNAARVRSDLTRSVFSTKLRIYRIGNLHGVTIRREFRHSVQIVEFEHVVTDRLRKIMPRRLTAQFARDHPRPGQAWGRVAEPQLRTLRR